MSGPHSDPRVASALGPAIVAKVERSTEAGETDLVTEWQIDFLMTCCGQAKGSTMGHGAFSPGPAVWVGTREVAHFDAERILDVRLTRAVIRLRRDELRSDGRVALRGSGSDWLEISVESTQDVAWATEIVVDAVVANLRDAPAGLPPTGADLDRRRRFH